MIRKHICLLLLLFVLSFSARAVEASALFESLRQKVLAVKDYTAEVKMKINVTYMRIPQLGGTLYFKSPDKMRLERHGGLSILPKKNINLTLRNLIPTGPVTVIDAGNETMDGKQVHVIKVIPADDNADIVLTKIWIDEGRLVALRTETTTRNNGTVKMELQYDKYISYGLPDKATIYMDIKDFKLPKGVAMDYNNDQPAKPQKEEKNHKGTIQITYLSYQVNKGISDNIFIYKE